MNKHLLPANDPGRFDLKIDGNIEGSASEVGDGGTTGTIAVPSGKHAVSESASSSTSLDDYRVQIVCRGGGGDGDVVAEGSGASLDVKVSKGAAIVCTITNEAKENARRRLARSELRGLRREHARTRRLGLLEQVGRPGGHPDRTAPTTSRRCPPTGNSLRVSGGVVRGRASRRRSEVRVR